MTRTHLRKLVHSGAAALIGALAATSATADDTEIYLTNPEAASGLIRPNVLLIMDTSGSMNATVDDLNAATTNLSRMENMKNALKSLLDSLNNVNVGLMRFTDPGGPILFPVADINANADEIEGTGAGSSAGADVSTRVPASADDAQEKSTAVTTNGPELTLGTSYDVLLSGTCIRRTGANSDSREQRLSDGAMITTGSTAVNGYDMIASQSNGVRFPGPCVNAGGTAPPPDAIITDAFITWTARASSATDVTVRYYGERADNPGTFTTAANNISSRTKTNSFSDWDPPSFLTGTGNTCADAAVNGTPRACYDSPNLRTIVQEIVCRGVLSSSIACPTDPYDGAFPIDEGAWTAANAMVFINTFAESGSRTAHTHAGAGTTAASRPHLTVKWETTSGLTTPVKAGLRFKDVGIPQGATITSATIEFTASRDTPVTDAATTYRVTGELAADPAAFTTAASNITGRADTTAFVDWTGATLPAWITDNVHSTPELKTVVQEMVNQAGWCGNNHMAFFVTHVTGADTRQAYSADGDPTKAPILHVSYDASSLPAGGGCINEFVQRQVAASSDDAEQVSGTMSLTSVDLDMLSSSTNGMRFQSLNLPRNTTILEAKLIFNARTTQSGAVSHIYRGELSGDAATFGSTANNISSRPLTAASVTHSSVPAWTLDQQFESPDLTPIIQEIVNQSGWDIGHDLAIIQTASGTGNREAKTADQSAAVSPILKIKVQWGGSILPPVFTTVRERLKQIVDGFAATGYTPIVGTLYEGAQYYRGAEVTHGKKRSHWTSQKDNTRVSHSASWTGGTLVRPPGCTDSNLSSTACNDEEITGSPVYVSPITSGASCATNHMILLTDGSANHNANEGDDVNATFDHGLGLVQSLVGTSSCRTSTSVASSDTTTGNSISSGERCGRELTAWLHNNDLRSGLAGTQALDNFYAVGFNLCEQTAARVNGELVCCESGTVVGPVDNATSCTIASDPSSVRFLKDLVKNAGGDPATGYKDAFTADQLVSFFQAAFAEILSTPTSFVAPSLAANAFNRLFSRDEVYFGLFTPTLNVKWDGNVKKYNICDDPNVTPACSLGDVIDANGNPAVGADGQFSTESRNLWPGDSPFTETNGQAIKEGGAGGEIDDYTARIIYTEATATGTAPSSGTSLETAGFKLTSDPAVHDSSTVQAIRNSTCSNGAVGDAACNSLLLWMLGKDELDEDGDGSTTDTRWSFNDVLHSSPVVVTYGKDASTGDIIDKVLVGTNEGGLRMINGKTGEEEWVFIPQALLANQQTLFSNPQGNHVYGLDQTPTVRIVDNDGDGFIEPASGDAVHVFVGMRRGGQNIYALNITPAATLTSVSTTITPKFLWRIEGGSGDFTRLGETWSRPQSVDILTVSGSSAVKTPVLIFGGGYDGSLENGFGNVSPLPNPNSGNAIYIVDAATGSRIMWVSHSGTGADIEVTEMTYAIPTDVSTVDSDGDGAVDRLYAGDVGGQVWRVDLDGVRTSGANREGDSVAGRLAYISDPATAADQRRFFFPPSVVQVKDTVYSDASQGEYDYVLLPTGNRGHPLDTAVSDRFYAFRDKTIGKMSDSNNDNLADGYADNGSPIANDDLIDVTNQVLDPDSAEHRAALGWFYDFTESGEKGLSAPSVLANTAVFTSYLPLFDTDNPCAANAGSGRAYNFNILSTGAAYNWDNDDTTGGDDLADRFQELGSGIPSEVVPIFTEGGVTLLIGTGGGAENLGKVMDLPRYRTYWYEEGL